MLSRIFARKRTNRVKEIVRFKSAPVAPITPVTPAVEEPKTTPEPDRFGWLDAIAARYKTPVTPAPDADVNVDSNADYAWENGQVKPVRKGGYDSALIIRWVVNVAGAIGESESDVEAVLLNAANLKDWADAIAVLEFENFHALKRECIRRLNVNDYDVYDALLARYGD